MQPSIEEARLNDDIMVMPQQMTHGITGIDQGSGEIRDSPNA